MSLITSHWIWADHLIDNGWKKPGSLGAGLPAARPKISHVLFSSFWSTALRSGSTTGRETSGRQRTRSPSKIRQVEIILWRQRKGLIRSALLSGLGDHYPLVFRIHFILISGSNSGKCGSGSGSDLKSKKFQFFYLNFFWYITQNYVLFVIYELIIRVYY